MCVQRGVYLVMERLHGLCLRTFIKRVHQCQIEEGGHETQLRLSALTAACTGTGYQVDLDEVRCHCACTTLLSAVLYNSQYAVTRAKL